MLKDYETEGWPVWIDQSPRVGWVVKTRKSNSAAALERWRATEQKRMEKKGAVPKYGVAPYVTPQTLDGGKMPTKREWVEAQDKGRSGQVADADKMAEFKKRKRAAKMRNPKGD